MCTTKYFLNETKNCDQKVLQRPSPFGPTKSLCNILRLKSLTAKTHRLLGVTEYYLKGLEYKFLPQYIPPPFCSWIRPSSPGN